MKYYPDLTLAEIYLVNFRLQTQKHLDHFQEENEMTLNKILSNLGRKNIVIPDFLF